LDSLTDPPVTWLAKETDRLLEVTARAAGPTGFEWLDEHLQPTQEPLHLWLNGRMTFVSALGALLGRDGFSELVDHGMTALAGPFQDSEHGGWFTEIGDGRPVDDTKAAYAHSFVVLAASAATALGRPGASALLADALGVVDTHFWDESAGLVREPFDRGFTTTESYRGINANMHMVEAFLAAADATGEDLWLDRAVRMTERAVHRFARGNDWRLPEHFTPEWTPLPDYNREDPTHKFRPYGSTIGHWMEWARLTLQVRAALEVRGRSAPDWTLADPIALFDQAVHQGWAADGSPGFVYTIDWDGAPVVTARMHWVLTEALGAAAALHTTTGEPRYAELHRDWWAHAESVFIDREHGSWHHERSPAGGPSTTVWRGKPDTYHSIQATLIPRLPLAPTFAKALADGHLDA